MNNLLPIYYQTAGIYYRPSPAPQSLAPGPPPNPLPIYYSRDGICYGSSEFSRQTPDSAAESSDNRQTILGNRPIHHPRSTDYLPIFSGYLPIRLLQPLASVAAHFTFQLSEFQLFPL